MRHGETAWNAKRLAQGQLNVSLSAKGRKQALALAERLSLEGFEAIYTSDLSRARETAEVVGGIVGLPVQSDPSLRERHYGIFQGLTYEDARQRFPGETVRHSMRDPDFVPFGGESLLQFADRVIRCVSELEEKHRGRSILVVTHGGVLDILFRYATGSGLSEPRSFDIPNAAPNWVEVAGGRWSVSAWADRGHSGETVDESPGLVAWPV